MTDPQGPIVIELDDSAPPPDPSSAPMVLDTATGPDADAGSATAAATRLAARPMSWLARLFWTAALSLFLLWLGTATWDFALSLLSRNIWLGRFAMGAGAILGLAALLGILRELASIRRLRSLDAFRRQALDIRRTEDAEAARALSTRLTGFYAHRSDLAWATGDMAALGSDVIDATDRLDLLEKTLMTPLDAQARIVVQTAARQVAAATAVVPLPLADVVVALISNLRMVRQVAEVYGGRSGTLGSWRLLRAVAIHLVATGAIGVADDMVSAILGGGVVAKLSRRFGEGIINGALTARVGVAAMELSRPLPFEACPRPGVSKLMGDALAGVFTKTAEDPPKQ